MLERDSFLVLSVHSTIWLVPPGMFLLLGALTKAIHPTRFASFLGQGKGLYARVQVIVFAEALLGSLLIFSTAAHLVQPLALFTYGCFSLLAFKRFFKKNQSDCGCFNGMLRLSPLWGLLLNLMMVVFLYLAGLNPDLESSGKKLEGPLLLALSIAILSWLGIRFYQMKKRPFFEDGPLAVGQTWQKSWFDLDMKTDKTILVLLFSLDCEKCLVWLNKLDERMTQGGVSIYAFYKQAHLDKKSYYKNIPLHEIEKEVFEKWRVQVPLLLMLKEDEITRKWQGVPPENFDFVGKDLNA